MPLRHEGPAPYAPPQTVIALIETYRDRGLAVPFTPDVLVRGGVPESLIGRVQQALRLLDLVDEAGHPTENLETLRRARGNDEYQARLREWVQAVYADVLRYTDPAVDSADRVAEAFRGYTPGGQRSRMVALMLRLFEYAGLTVASPTPTSERPPRPRPASGRPKRAAAPKSRPPQASGGQPTMIEAPPAAADGIPPGLVGLLREIPKGGSAWTTKRRDAFLQAFTAVLDFSVPVDDTESAGAVGDESEEEVPTS